MAVYRVRKPRPPAGLLRLALRAPVWLYRANLGGLLGGRFLLLSHTGRRTGRTRQTVLEVIDRDPDTGGWLVVAGFGTGAHWLRNITAHPRVRVRVGRGAPVEATAVRLPPAESGLTMVAFARHYPRAARILTWICGLRVDPTADDYAAVGAKHIAFVVITPVTPPP